MLCIVFSIWVFFHEHLRFTVQQGKGEAPLYYFHPLRRHLYISRTITAEGSPNTVTETPKTLSDSEKMEEKEEKEDKGHSKMFY